MRALADIVKDIYAGEVPNVNDELVEAWSEFLSAYPMEWFATFTFREDVHPEKADKLFRCWIAKLNRYLFGPRATHRTGLFWIRALELQKRGVIHFHALLGDPSSLQSKISFKPDKLDKASLWYWQELWFEMAGMCRIEEIKSQEKVRDYLTKYLFKDGEIDVSENFKDFVPPQSGLL